jgi:light-regulated signal transduction histidine kinase (bacteriophytochrome)
MKASVSRIEDTESLQDLGRASIQIVHDLKNQLNGLKLYATFLRRRIEKSERPDDEQETIGKLINGLDRAAVDLSMIVELGREIELKRQPGFEVAKVLRNLCSTFQEGQAQVVCESDADSIQGEFDHSKLTDALKSMFAGAVRFKTPTTP